MGIGMTKKSEAIWEKIRAMPEFSTNDIAAMGVSQGTGRRYCQKWQMRGLIRLVRTDDRNTHIYAPVDAPAPTAEVGKRPGTAEGNMWFSMRMLNEFTPTDIAAHSNAGGVQIEVKDAQTYCRALLNAGYLRVRVKARPGFREAVYRLTNMTGPNAPMIKRIRGVFDPNTEEFIPHTQEGPAWQRH